MRRRTWLTSCAGLVACPLTDEAPLDFAHLPKSAQAMATELGLGADQWTTYREQQRRSLALRIDEGSAEHITYYVLQ